MKPYPPLIATLCLAGAAALDLLLAARVSRGTLLPLPAPARPAGAALCLTGAAVGVWSLGLFRAHGTTYEPFEEPSALVTGGPYRYTRNPMYTGIALGLAGVALFTRRAALLLAPVAFAAIITAGQIRREEARLDALFGEAYRAYRRQVPRWPGLPR